jgi:hypothetical protein
MSTARDLLRAKLLQTRLPTSRTVDFFGSQIEIKQPTLGAILDARKEANSEGAIINTLVMYAYVPGTSELVFEEADTEALKAMPFGADFIRVTDALQELTSVNFLQPKPNSGETDSSGGPTVSDGNSDGDSPKSAS